VAKKTQSGEFEQALCIRQTGEAPDAGTSQKKLTHEEEKLVSLSD